MMPFITYIESSRIAIEFLLTGGLLWLCYSLFNGGWRNRRHAQELEGSLRALMTDAEAASGALNDQLLRRQNALEKILAELQGTEHRLSKALALAEEVKGELATEAKEGQRALESLREEAKKLKTQISREAPPRLREPEPVPEPPSFETSVRREVPQKRAETVIPKASRKPSEQRPPIVEPRPAEVVSRKSPLNQSVARQIVRESERDTQPVTRALESVYSAAESMLKSGKDVQSVSANTRLPLEEVRLLRDFLAKEEREEAQGEKLGALSPVRRQTQVL